MIVKSIRNSMLAATAAFAIAVVGVACGESSQEQRQDAAELQREADQAAADADRKAREEQQDAQRTARESGGRVDAAGETFSVKTALMADDIVDASDINVDTVAETRTVVLRGSVPTAEQKKRAEEIAMRESEGFKVDNQLTVKKRPQ
jgi:osmotically-inducible protein OsmY